MSPCDNCSHRRVCVFEDHPNYRKENCSNYEKIRPHGEWKGKPERRKMVTRICSACGDPSPVGYFCIWCGADMMTQNDHEVKNPCDTCKNVGDCEPCEKMREGEQE